MADHLASIFGTEKDRVNCPFYFKIGCVPLELAEWPMPHACLPLLPHALPPCFPLPAGPAATATAARACTTGRPSAPRSCSRTCTRTPCSTRRSAPTASPSP